MRTLIVLLSLVMFFLTGLIIGMDRSNHDSDASNVNKIVEQTDEAEQTQVVIEQSPSGEAPGEQTQPEHLTQKTASFLESGVKGFYELVVGITYQLVQVFF